MASSSCAAIDNSFGPHAGSCRGGFDLTLLFEESILIVPITAVLLLVTPWRILYLLRKSTIKVKRNYWVYFKIVSSVQRLLLLYNCRRKLQQLPLKHVKTLCPSADMFVRYHMSSSSD